MKALGLGIDTGGTFTDAVLVELGSSRVVASAKAPTTRHDLADGIIAAVRRLPERERERVALVSLSTTLATNAIVEGKGAPTCLVMIGYDQGLLSAYRLERLLPIRDVIFIAGGHDASGREVQPLDEAALRTAVRSRLGTVAAYAVSGFFSVRNPAHELRAKEIIEAESSCPVACGHELSSELDCILRASTCALNASLMPLLRELMSALRRSLEQLGIRAPAMVVRGDGSLMSVEMALQRPVETILSGPAASVVGGLALVGGQDMLVIDIGGTTTDVALVERGLPRLSDAGATVGGWRTLVRAVDTVSIGLGGDSEVYLARDGKLQVGPRRVLPLSYVAAQHPMVVELLRRALRERSAGPNDRLFVLVRSPGGRVLGAVEQRIVSALQKRPVASWEADGLDPWAVAYLSRQENALEREGLILRSYFTPTDALHVLREVELWEKEAALLGAELLGRFLGLSAEEVALKALAAVRRRLLEVALRGLVAGKGPEEQAGLDGRLLDLACSGEGANGHLEVRIVSRVPFVGLGAPVRHLLPALRRCLRAPLSIPEFHEVANAVGAICGSVTERVTVQVQAEYGVSGISGYRVIGPRGPELFEQAEEALSRAKEVAAAIARERALRAGAGEPQVSIESEDEYGTASTAFGDRIYLGSKVTGIAVGRPAIAAGAARAEVQATELW